MLWNLEEHMELNSLVQYKLIRSPEWNYFKATRWGWDEKKKKKSFFFLLWERLNSGADCPERLWSLSPWRANLYWTCLWATCTSWLRSEQRVSTRWSAEISSTFQLQLVFVIVCYDGCIEALISDVFFPYLSSTWCCTNLVVTKCL